MEPAKFCANCISKLVELNISYEGVNCKCSHCKSQKFSRCGRCHIVPYCSKECQLEHWSKHRKICKKLKLEGPYNIKDASNISIRAANPKEMFSFFFVSPGWIPFGAGFFPMGKSPFAYKVPFPFKMEEYHQHGWIAEYLHNISSLILRLPAKAQRMMKHFEMAMPMTWGFYYFLLAIEKDIKITEIKFTIVMMMQQKEWFDDVWKVCGVPGVKLEVVESLLFIITKFFRTLRMVKFKFLNMKSFKRKRREEYEVLRPFYENAMRVLDSATAERVDVDPFDRRSLGLTLPPNSRCLNCKADLGGLVAQHITITGAHSDEVGDLQAMTPYFMMFINLANPTVSCGRNLICNLQLKKTFVDYLFYEEKALMKILPDTRICHGCSRYSLKTHRCSRCRQVRYCSQDCMNQSWGEHQIRCREFTRPGVKELYQTKKLEGKAKQRFTAECQERLVIFDPYLKGLMGQLPQ